MWINQKTETKVNVQVNPENIVNVLVIPETAIKMKWNLPKPGYCRWMWKSNKNLSDVKMDLQIKNWVLVAIPQTSVKMAKFAKTVDYR